MNKKILYIAPKIPFPPTDGHTKSMYGFIKSTYHLGYLNDLVCYTQNKKHQEELNKVCNPFYLEVETQNNIVDVIKNFFSRVPYNLAKYKRKELIKFLENHLKNNEYDFIVIFNSHMGWIVDYLKAKTKSKIILREENLELSIMEKFYQNQKNIFLKIYSWIQYKKFIKYEPALCEKFDACLMISNQDKEKLLTYSKNVNAIVVNSGIDENLLKLKKINVDKYSIFHIGSLNWYPNLDGLMWFLDKIFPKIISKEPRSRLFIYGSRLPENILLKNEIKNHVVNVGFVENLWNEIKDKQIAIVPLRIGSGIRIKILELLASSNIVVTTSLGAEGIGLTNKKNILIADDANMFAGEILKLFNDKYEIEEMIELSKNYIEQNYSWNVIAKKIETELNNLI